jgi:hypothetical protein
MAAENPLWGEERIANELLVKLGIRVSPRTGGKYDWAAGALVLSKSILSGLHHEYSLAPMPVIA